MFIGHYSASYALKRVEPRIPIFALLIAAQFMDFLFMTFILFGIEKMKFVPNFTAVNNFALYYMPISHSMVGSLVWSVLFGLVVGLIIQKRGIPITRSIVICGAAVFSHFILDVAVHTPDMPLFTDDSIKLGFGVWNHRAATIMIEIAVLSVGWCAYLGASKPGVGFGGKYGPWIFFSFLVLVTIVSPFMPPPTSFIELSSQALAAYVIIALLGRWVDSKRIYVA